MDSSLHSGFQKKALINFYLWTSAANHSLLQTHTDNAGTLTGSKILGLADTWP